MKNWKRLKALPVYILMASVVSACGASTTTFQNSAGSAAANNSNTLIVMPSPSPSPTAAAQALNYEIMNTGTADAVGTCKDCLTGQGGNYPTWSSYNATGGYINTDNLFQVVVTVASSGELSADGTLASGTSYSNFSAEYDCASYEVSVYDQNGNYYGQQTTGMLVVPGSEGCFDELAETDPSELYNGNPASELLDFSGNVGQGPHGGLNVEVQALDYDFYCRLLYDYLGDLATESEYYSEWCPYKTVYKTHTISAQIQVNINGTTLQ